MTLTETVAKNLYAARNERNLSQADIAKAVGVSVSYVSMLENARRTPPLQTIQAFARALRISPLSLFERLPRRVRSRGMSGRRSAIRP